MPKLHVCLSRGVNISVLRHEAEFYGITPLGMLHYNVFLGGGLQFKQHGSTSQVFQVCSNGVLLPVSVFVISLHCV